MIKKYLSTLTALALFMGISAGAFAEEVATTGTLIVNQAGALGTVAVAGPSTASVTTASSTIAAAAVGSYTIAVTAPTGFVLGSVKDGANVVLASPYTQTLAAAATITFNVNFVAAPAVPPVTPPVATEITKQMIKDKTALCAAMKGGKDKKACMKERNKMKRDFQKQEKAKHELARQEAKLAKEAARAQLEAKKLACEQETDPAKKATCLTELAALKASLKLERDSKRHDDGDDGDDDEKEGKGKGKGNGKG